MLHSEKNKELVKNIIDEKKTPVDIEDSHERTALTANADIEYQGSSH